MVKYVVSVFRIIGRELLNNKIIAAIVVVVLVVAGVGVYFMMQENDRELNIISGVNTEGSGIFIDSSVKIESMIDMSSGEPVYLRDGWEGKVFSTPGLATIQHVQLLEIVEGMGLTFTAFKPGVSEPDTVYYFTNMSNAGMIIPNEDIDGGILWQPQYQKIVDTDGGRFKPLALMNDLYPGHICCVMAGAHSYTSTHESETVRFLAAYIKATDWVNNALANQSSDEYKLLIEVAKNSAGTNFTENEIKTALDTVTYFYGENSSTPLAGVKDSVKELAENLVDLKLATKTFQDLGFKDSTEFINKYVEDKFMIEALDIVYNGAEPEYEGTSDITVAVIGGDVHQIAVHMAKELGYYEELGLNVKFSTATNGSGVATAIQNGNASIGLLGAPPLTTTVINGELVKA